MIEFDYSDENIKRTIEKDFFDRNIYLDKVIGDLIKFMQENVKDFDKMHIA